MIEQAIYHTLSTTALITDVVNDRIYPEFVPEGQDFPAVSFTRVSTEFDHSKAEPSTVGNALMQINAIHPNREQCADLGYRIRQVMDKMQGTVNGVAVQTSFLEGIDYTYDMDAKAFMEIQRYSFTYNLKT
jgi:hypothetical protein